MGKVKFHSVVVRFVGTRHWDLSNTIDIEAMKEHDKMGVLHNIYQKQTQRQ